MKKFVREIISGEKVNEDGKFNHFFTRKWLILPLPIGNIQHPLTKTFEIYKILTLKIVFQKNKFLETIIS